MRSKSLSSATITTSPAEIAECVKISIQKQGIKKALSEYEAMGSILKRMTWWPEVEVAVEKIIIDERQDERLRLERLELKRLKAKATKIIYMQPPRQQKKKGSDFSAVVTNPDKADLVIALLHKHTDGKQKPQDFIMPIRAAQDAGVIRRPTYGEAESEFGAGHFSKGSFSYWTNDSNKYYGPDYANMVEVFRQL